ncbi:hypothetical protein C8R43DRAFT_1123038 [Mycena crocata]|nr:hypothetical protein C8R43DRAFT_1123038 [Mycena crocata]
MPKCSSHTVLTPLQTPHHAIPARGPPAVRQYIDDRAQEADAEMSDDDQRADSDSAEDLIQAMVAQDFDMAGLQVDHEARQRSLPNAAPVSRHHHALPHPSRR